MTAEIGILNKTAVAFATDSAVTISAGTEYQKIYETADKLFELSIHQPIGIMIYNSMSFMEMPLPTMIKDFRSQCDEFSRIQDAGKAFLDFLSDQNHDAPESVTKRSNENAVDGFVRDLYERMNLPHVTMDIFKKIGPTVTYEQAFNQDLSNRLDFFITVYSKIKKANFVGTSGTPRYTSTLKDTYRNLVQAHFNLIDGRNLNKFVTLCGHIMKGERLSQGRTGIIIAGFGKEDRFPTLIAYEIDGIVGKRLKYVKLQVVDIDRDGTKAAIVPFAQKDMVARFVYGLDDEVINGIEKACRSGLEDFSNTLQSIISLKPAEAAVMEAAATAGRSAFIQKFREDAINGFRDRSRREIEDMVEFMPKPEMARMAEALVDLTSIKRRVTRGMETVGGPIDVAIISREDGFVWVQRKHYFPEDRNLRYRLRNSVKN